LKELGRMGALKSFQEQVCWAFLILGRIGFSRIGLHFGLVPKKFPKVCSILWAKGVGFKNHLKRGVCKDT